MLHSPDYAMFQNQYFIILERNNKFVAEVWMRNFSDRGEMVRCYSEIERDRKKREERRNKEKEKERMKELGLFSGKKKL
jgi:hypothetical protein